jgi:hypothetical protein
MNLKQLLIGVTLVAFMMLSGCAYEYYGHPYNHAYYFGHPYYHEYYGHDHDYGYHHSRIDDDHYYHRDWDRD